MPTINITTIIVFIEYTCIKLCVFQVNSSKAVLNNEMSLSYRLTNPDPSLHGHRTTVLRNSHIAVDLAIPGPSSQVLLLQNKTNYFSFRCSITFLDSF